MTIYDVLPSRCCVRAGESTPHQPAALRHRSINDHSIDKVNNMIHYSTHGQVCTRTSAGVTCTHTVLSVELLQLQVPRHDITAG